MSGIRGTAKGVNTFKIRTEYQVRLNDQVLFTHRKCKRCWLWLSQHPGESKYANVFALIGPYQVKLERSPSPKQGQQIKANLVKSYLREARFRALHKRCRAESKHNEAAVV